MGGALLRHHFGLSDPERVLADDAHNPGPTSKTPHPARSRPSMYFECRRLLCQEYLHTPQCIRAILRDVEKHVGLLIPNPKTRFFPASPHPQVSFYFAAQLSATPTMLSSRVQAFTRSPLIASSNPDYGSIVPTKHSSQPICPPPKTPPPIAESSSVATPLLGGEVQYMIEDNRDSEEAIRFQGP